MIARGEGTLEAVLVGEARWCVVHGEGVSIGERHAGVDWGARDVLATLPDLSVDHVLTDPPYSAAVHKNMRSSKRDGLPDVAEFACRARRQRDLHFDPITVPEMEALCDQVERICRRWFAVFSDVESCHLWRGALTEFEYIRTAAWFREGGAPQFTGDRPSSGFEAITLSHRKGRKRWNGGGKSGTYAFPIVANRAGHRGDRLNEAQKPEGLMLALARDFTDPGELIVDAYNGSGTTGVAALRLGCRYIGIERRLEQVEKARARFRALNLDETLHAGRGKRMRQLTLA